MKNDAVNTEVISVFSGESTLRASNDVDAAGQKASFQQWAKQRQERGKFDLGFSFSNLQAHGYLSSANYQHTFGSYILAVPHNLRSAFRIRKDEKVRILHNMEGLVKSGEMLLVLGRPGSGCSTFLKTIAGDTHGFVVDETSTINYQGLSYSEMHKHCRAESIYVAELDVHFPELKLGQTLAFAAGANGSSKNAGDVSRWVAPMFNLRDAFDTPMGNDMIRGVSGGEMKRVSIAEAFISGAKVQCWNNSTRGLDSSTALDLIVLLRDMADLTGSAVLVSVYQASEDIYNNFDKVMLLYEGRQIFFGSTATAVRYFTSMGFVKAAKVTSSDFLTSLTSPSERILAPGYEHRVPYTPDQFAQVWKQSLERGMLSQNIEGFNVKYPTRPGNLKKYLEEKASAMGNPKSSRSPYTIPTFSQINLCLSRALKRLANNSEPVVSGIIGNAIIGIIIGSVFYNLDNTSASIDSRALLLFFAIMLNACTSGMEILTIWAQRPIVEKHSRYDFYHPFTEAVASMICDLPNKIMTSLLFNLALYFMTNLRRTPGAFFTYYLFSFVALLTMSMVFRMMGSLSKRIEQSMAPGAIMIANLIIYTGFVVPVPYMKPWFGWIRWINPIFYAYESIMINEFQDRRFPCAQIIPSGPSYTNVSEKSTICSSVGARRGKNFVDGSAYLYEKFRFTTSHLWRNLALIIILMVVYCTIYLLAVEYIPTERSKGEILRFRRRDLQAVKHKIASEDEEAQPIALTASDFKRKDSAIESPRSGKLVEEFNERDAQTRIFHWSNVSYDIKINKKETKRLLHEVDGWVKPGTLTALMGATGAGKTTLLDVLASRASIGIVSGDIFVDGHARHPGFQRQTGYVQQADLHLPTSTVREALQFSALLRQPRSTSKAEKFDFVEHVLRLLEMEEYADAIVGVPGEGLNVEQRRRLSIAVEMAARPSLLLFLDEPTSGLDSQTAWSICVLLRKLAASGQAILCTIHQPSAQLFEMFDQLLLLEKGGRTLYFGETSKMPKYFEKNGARTCGQQDNPAEWMLDVTGATPTSSNKVPWAEVWSRSPEKTAMKVELQVVLQQGSNLMALPPLSYSVDLHDSEFAAPFTMQLLAVSYRTFADYWRTPSYLYSKLALCIGAALFNGFSFFFSDSSVQGLVNIIFSIFLLTNIFTSVNQQIIPKFVASRQLFEAREMRSKTYAWGVFVGSQIIVELAWQTLVAVLVFVCWYYPTGLWRNGDASFGMNERAVLAFLFIWMFCLFTSTFSQAMAAGMQHAETAVGMTQLLFYLCVIFCGVIVQPQNLPGFWKFMYRVSPLTYLIHGMVSAGLGNTEIVCSATEILRVESPFNTTCGDYFSDYIRSAGGAVSNPSALGECLFCPVSEANAVLGAFGVEVEQRWRDFGIFMVYVVFNVGMTFLLCWLARVPKGKKN